MELDVLQVARFEGQRTECHVLETACEPTSGVVCTHIESDLDLETLASTRGRRHATAEPSTQSLELGTLVCLLQDERCAHKPDRSDKLPFPSGEAAQRVFESFGLPMAYFRVVHATVAVAHAAAIPGRKGLPEKFEFVANCISWHADWGFALSHLAASNTTSIFWSLGSSADPEFLMDDLLSKKHLSHHPMLVPCIMFSHMFELAVERRADIKRKLARLEGNVWWLSTNGVSKSDQRNDDRETDYQSITDSEHIESLSETLNACRSEQGSREGRYHSWESYYRCLEEGFAYWERINSTQENQQSIDAHIELQSFAELTWAQMQSLKARDVDEVTRVSEASEMVCMRSSRRSD